MGHNRERRLLSPVLADEQLVGEGLTRRLRIVLLSVVAAFALTNFTSYLIGQAIRADADRDTRAKVTELDEKVTTDIKARGAQRDVERKRMEEINVAQQRELTQMRRDLCVALDRLSPRDGEVVQARRRYGCTGGVTGPAASQPAPAGGASQGSGSAGAGSSSGGGSAAGGAPTSPRPPAGPAGPASPSGPPGPAAPAPTTPPPTDDGGLICLPVVGCVL